MDDELERLRTELAETRAQLQQARHAERTLRDVLEHSGAGMVLCELDRKVVFCNRSLHEMLGYREGELLGHVFPEITHPDDLGPTAEAWRRLREEKLPHLVLDKRFFHKDGSLVWTRIRLTLIHDEAGVPLYGLATVLNLDDHKQAEHALMESQARLAAIVERSADAIYIKDAAGRYILMNPAGAALVGRTTQDFLGRRDDEIFGEPGRQLMAVDAAVMATGQLHTSEEELESQDHSPRTFSTTKYPYRNARGEVLGIVGISRDITPRKRLEEALSERNERLMELDRLKSSIVSAVSHEFRTPLTLIKGYAEFLAEQAVGPLTDEQHDFVDKIGSGVDRLERLVSDLLDTSSIEAGVFRLVVAPTDLAALVGRTVDELQPLAREARLSLAVAVPAGPLAMTVDAQRIQQVLTNLVSNAVKFTPAGGRVEVRLAASPGGVRCEVEDTGIGIPQDQCERLFERFNRLENGLRRGGTGLGLSICKALVEAHGGSLRVGSTPGRGSTFTFELPAREI